ncbi:MAG: hypothetical protein QOF60_2565 [Actinomycetota bacterium]|nr:hypothetical protein [Actinomycetota bacterium]
MLHELLIVDGNLEMRSLLHRAVANLDATVTEAASGAEALRVMRSRPVDIALIDLGLPDMSGLQVLSELRRLAPDAHLIVVSGDPSEGARLRSFGTGADDFVQKPFSGAELAARVAVGMRRRRDRAEGRLTFDDLHIDLSARQVEVAGTSIALRRLEFDLLAHLALHPGHMFSREDLLRAVWGSSADFQGPATVTEHVRRIRNKLDALAQEGGWIETVQGSGYRFRERPGVPRPVHPLATELLAKRVPVEVVINLEDGTVIDLSDGAVEFFGALTSEEIIGRSFTDRVAPLSVEAVQLRRERARRGDWPEPEEIFLQRLDGIPVAAQIVSTLARRGDHDVANVSILAANSRRSELLQSVLTGVTSEVADAVIVTDAAYRIRSLNPAAELMYGWAESDVIGHPITDVIAWPSDADRLQGTRDALDERDKWAGEAWQRCRDGEMIRVRGTVTTLLAPDGQPFAVVAVNRRIDSAAIPAASPSVGQLDVDLLAAIDHGQVVPYYQPIVRLHDRHIIGYEALARWELDDGNILGADEIIPYAESADLIIPLGSAILEAACADLARWHAAGHNLQLAVNVSAKQLADPAFPELVAGCITRHNLPAGSVWIEVTETSLIEDVRRASASLAVVAAAGARIAIDDFGAGWASLTYLRAFPVSGLKIDRTFVHELATGGTDEIIVRAILRLARELSLDVIAEGIESELQSEALRALGCTVGQGFLLGRPAPASEVARAVGCRAD